MLQNAYLLAKIGADTAENELNLAEILPIGRRVARGAARRRGGDGALRVGAPARHGEPPARAPRARGGARRAGRVLPAGPAAGRICIGPASSSPCK